MRNVLPARAVSAAGLLLLAAACRAPTAVAPTDPPQPAEPSPTLSPTATATVEASSTPTATSASEVPVIAATGLFRLTSDPGIDRDPTWAPDASRIAFTSDRTGTFEIYSLNVDGTGLAQLTDDGEFGLDKQTPDWSPDGKRIAFVTLFDLYFIYAFKVEPAYSQPFSALDDSRKSLLSDLSTDSMSPAWSPDGSLIAFTMKDMSLVSQVFLLDPVTWSSLQLTHGTYPAYGPKWSPDGRQIAFTSVPSGHLDIYVIGVDGTGLTRLTDYPANDGDVSWSPDGRYIAFDSDRGGCCALYIMRADGSEVVRLDVGEGDNFDPVWSPDGQYIVFVTDRDGNLEIYRIDAPTLQP